MMPVKITRTPLWEWVRGAAELWRCRVPIGDTLAGARQRAGLTVAEVSEQTRIKEAVIRGIEGDDYSGCGGDFYARANIRGIAKAVGADSGPLIAEYDALHRARGVLPAVSLEELLATSAPAEQRRWPGWPAVGGLAASGNGPAYRPRGRWLYWVVVLGLVVVLGFGVYSRFFAPRHAAAVPPAGGKHAVAHQPPGPGGPGPAPKLTHAAVTPSPAPKLTHAAAAPAPAPGLTHAAVAPAPAAAVPTLTPAGAGAPGPGGGSAPPPAHRAAGGSGATEPSHQVVRHRPLPEPVLTQEPAHDQARSSHDHDRRDRYRRRTPAAQQDGSQYGGPGVTRDS